MIRRLIICGVILLSLFFPLIGHKSGTFFPEGTFFQRDNDSYVEALPYINVKPSCNCTHFAEQFPQEFHISTREGLQGHKAVIIKDEGDSWIIIESNYIRCQISIRRIYKNSPLII